MTLELGFAEEFPVLLFRVHGSTLFMVGATHNEGFVLAGPAGVGGFTIVGLGSATREAVAFFEAGVAEAEFLALGAQVVSGAILAIDEAR